MGSWVEEDVYRKLREANESLTAENEILKGELKVKCGNCNRNDAFEENVKLEGAIEWAAQQFEDMGKGNRAQLLREMVK